MTGVVANAVWVSGERYNIDYLLDVGDGHVLRRVELDERGGTTGGVGRPCAGVFVAVYVALKRDGLVLQIGADRVALGPDVRATHRRRLGGVKSLIDVSRPGRPSLQARQWNGAGAILRRVDPAYDELDALGDDFLADVANIVNSPERQDWMLSVKDPSEGPWDA